MQFQTQLYTHLPFINATSSPYAGHADVTELSLKVLLYI